MRSFPRNPNGILHTILRREDQVTVDDQKDVHLMFYWRLRDFTSSTTWDYYKINCVVMTFYPEQTPTYPMKTGLNRPINYVWIDYDDEDVPKEVPYNRAGLKHWMADQKFSIKIFPRVLASAGQSSYKPNEITKSDWINTYYNDTHFLGLKASFSQIQPQGMGNEKCKYKIVMKAYVSFSQPILLNA